MIAMSRIAAARPTRLSGVVTLRLAPRAPAPLARRIPSRTMAGPPRQTPQELISRVVTFARGLGKAQLYQLGAVGGVVVVIWGVSTMVIDTVMFFADLKVSGSSRGGRARRLRRARG